MTSVHCSIIKHVENTIQYLDQLLPLVNCHMVEYFSKSLYDLHVPKDIRKEIDEIGFDCAIDVIFGNRSNTDTPSLNQFITKAKAFALHNTNICLDYQKLHEKLHELGGKSTSGLKMEIFMKQKKSHEVEILSAVAASIQEIANASHIIDIGDGKGYLSSMLAFHHKIPVLGVDSSLLNTTSAIKRARQLEKRWNSIAKPSDINSNGEIPANNLYKQVTHFVTDKTNFKELVANIFLEHPQGLSLVGLHTCGDLGPASVKIFSNSNDVKTICNISCCYHLLTERQVCDENLNCSTGFPMSRLLRERKFSVSRNARMLAAQSIDRILHNREIPSKTIFYRAVFEVLLLKYSAALPNKNVGRFRKRCPDFVHYVSEALKRIQSDLSVPERDIINLYEMFVEREQELHVFNLLRCMLAPVVESLILLDRLLYLHERGHSKSFLVQLFDPIISPRCYGLIAFK